MPSLAGFSLELHGLAVVDRVGGDHEREQAGGPGDALERDTVRFVPAAVHHGDSMLGDLLPVVSRDCVLASGGQDDPLEAVLRL